VLQTILISKEIIPNEKNIKQFGYPLWHRIYKIKYINQKHNIL